MHVTLPAVANHADVTEIDEAICDSGFKSRELDPSWTDTFIEKGQVFDSLEHVKLFFQAYAVRHHQPYYVAKSQKNLRYTIRCRDLRCNWGVWLRPLKCNVQKWKVVTVKQPHMCGRSDIQQVHPQCTTRFLGRWIVSIVWADSDTMVAALIEFIQGVTMYRVRYGKAWRAKQHAMSLLWGD